MSKKKDFLTEFNRIKQSIKQGTTPVFSELRSTKTELKELFPYLLIQSSLLVISTLIVNALNLSALSMLVIVLIVDTTTATISRGLLVYLKHCLRVRKLKKYHLEVSEENLAVLESMEYQSV